MVMHPYEKLNTANLRRLTGWLVVAWGVLAIVAFWVVSPGHLAHIRDVALATNADRANELLAAWPGGVRESAVFLIGFDFLFGTVQYNAVATACVWGGMWYRAEWARSLTRYLAWIMWLNVPLNFWENLLFFDVVRGLADDPWPRVVGFQAIFIFTTMWSSLALGLALIFAGYRRTRNT